jgi:hypothetical protein
VKDGALDTPTCRQLLAIRQTLTACHHEFMLSEPHHLSSGGWAALQAQPGPTWQVSALAMQVSPHATPVEQTSQQLDGVPPPQATADAMTNPIIKRKTAKLAD